MTNSFGNLRDRALKLLATSPPQEVDGLLQEMHVLHAELEVQQDELRESQRRASELAAYYRQLFFESPLAFVVLTDEGKVHEANQQATWLLGWSTGETALPFAQHVAAEDQSEWTRLVTRAADAPASSELRIRRVGGERRLCRVTLSPRPGGGWLLGMQDLTALRDAEARQRIASERAARMQRDTRDGVLFVNADVRLIDEANQAIASLLGHHPRGAARAAAVHPLPRGLRGAPGPAAQAGRAPAPPAGGDAHLLRRRWQPGGGGGHARPARRGPGAAAHALAARRVGPHAPGRRARGPRRAPHGVAEARGRRPARRRRRPRHEQHAHGHPLVRQRAAARDAGRDHRGAGRSAHRRAARARAHRAPERAVPPDAPARGPLRPGRAGA